jgi:hypothetical protein
MRWTVKDDQPGELFAFFPPDIKRAMDARGERPTYDQV